MNILYQVIIFPCTNQLHLFDNACIMVFSPGKGVPNRLRRSNSLVQPVSSTLIPSSEEAVEQFHTGGGQLTLISHFGADPLDGEDSLISERDRRLQSGVGEISSMFHTLVNGNDQPFRDGLKLFIQLTEELSA